jgi:hypothetical protein
VNPRVTDVSFSIATPRLAARGCLGWVSFVVDGTYRVDGATIRRTTSGRLALSLPVRRDAANREHVVLRVLDDRVRASIEAQVIRALACDGRLAS